MRRRREAMHVLDEANHLSKIYGHRLIVEEAMDCECKFGDYDFGWAKSIHDW